jgi:hypothetical protein
MIKFQNLVPSVYPNASRDFQYLCWLIDIVLNSVKHNVDDLYDLPNTKADPRLTELLAMTLGFKVKRNYDKKQLSALVSIIPKILKYKGTIRAIELAGNALINSSGATGSFRIEKFNIGTPEETDLQNNCLVVVLPKERVDTTLFMDLLPYILPAGITCRIIRKTEDHLPTAATELSFDDRPKAAWVSDLGWDSSTQTSTGLASLTNTDKEIQIPILSSFKNGEADNYILNEGLLDNSLIPVLENPLLATELPKPEVAYKLVPNDFGTTVVINNFSEDSDEPGTVYIGGKNDTEEFNK